MVQFDEIQSLENGFLILYLLKTANFILHLYIVTGFK